MCKSIKLFKSLVSVSVSLYAEVMVDLSTGHIQPTAALQILAIWWLCRCC